ncbi:MAG: flagellin [Candidatus Bathyarchaeota archaeon B26-2]|nr:MAG: flagellin [Candidatus Bathyarchaeota archaeon B26-2]
MKKVTSRIVRNKRALSPVIATVVLVAVTIVVAVAVSYWMGGIAGLYTRFEKIEIVKSYAVKESNGNFTVTIELKNSGSADATIQYVLVNGRPLDDYGANMTISPSLPASIPIGQSQAFTISINGTLFTSGTTLDLKFHSAAGKDYPVMLTLP